jgi:pre-mycofactocin synthase
VAVAATLGLGGSTPCWSCTPEPFVQAGIENVLDILHGGIDSALLGLGKASIGDLTSDDLVIPPGFTRTLGGDGPVFDPALDEQAVTG